MAAAIRRVQTNGYTTYVYLPRRITRELGLKPGDFVLIERHNDGILLKPIEVHEKRAFVERKEKGWPLEAPQTPGGLIGGGPRDEYKHRSI